MEDFKLLREQLWKSIKLLSRYENSTDILKEYMEGLMESERNSNLAFEDIDRIAIHNEILKNDRSKFYESIQTLSEIDFKVNIKS